MLRARRVAAWAGAALLGMGPAGAGLSARAATVDRPEDATFSGKLIATGGVTQVEGAAALLLDRHLVAGVEYRMKPDTLARANPGLAPEDDWYDAFVAWLPTRNLAVTLAYVNLGRVVTPTRQNAVYLSLQAGF